MSTQDHPASCKVVMAGSIAKRLQFEVGEGLSKLERKPLLVGFLANKVGSSSSHSVRMMSTHDRLQGPIGPIVC